MNAALLCSKIYTQHLRVAACARLLVLSGDVNKDGDLHFNRRAAHPQASVLICLITNRSDLFYS